MEFTPRTLLLLLLAVAAAVLLHEGSTQQDSQRPSVKVKVGETAILPVNLNASLDVTKVKVQWSYNDSHVYVFQNNKPYLPNQNKAYKNRAFLFEDQISKGNVSLKLINVTEQDAGIYKCVVVRGKPPKEQDFEYYLHTLVVSTHKDPTGVRIGLGIGVPVVLVFLVVLAGFIFLVLRCRRENRNDQNNRDCPNNSVELNDQNNPTTGDEHNNSDNPDDQDSQEDQTNQENRGVQDNQDERRDQDDPENENAGSEHDGKQINEDKNAHEGSSLLKDKNPALSSELPYEDSGVQTHLTHTS